MKSEYLELGQSPNKSPDVPALDDSTFYGRESGIMYQTDSSRRPSIPGYFQATPGSPMTFFLSPATQPMSPMTEGMSGVTQGMSGVTQGMSPMTEPMSRVTEGMSRVTQPMSGVTESMSRVTQPMSRVTEGMSGVTEGMSRVSSHATPTPNMISSATNPRSLVTTASGKVRSRPCDACRKRKARCQTEPNATQCNKCAVRGIPCTFLDHVTPKRRRVDSPDSANLGNVNPGPNPSPGNPNLGNPSPGTSQSGNPNPGNPNPGPNHDPNPGNPNPGNPNPDPNPGPPLKDTLPISDYSSLPGKSLLKKTLSLQYPKSSFYVGHTSVHDVRFFDTATLDNIGQCVLNKDTAMRRVAPDVLFTIRNDFADDLRAEFISNSDSVERIVAPHGLALIDLYFRIVHPAFPILHKRIFMEKYARTHREFSPPLLAAVYILALKWWSYEPQLASQPKPDVEKLSRLALNSFSDLYEQPKLSVVQAGLLILQCSMERARNWILISHVISLAEELGLGMDCQSWRLPRWERALRRRLAWAVFIQDKWVALIEGRPSHIDESRQWLVRKIAADDFPDRRLNDDLAAGRLNGRLNDDVETENGRLLFMEMVRLSEIVSEILDTFFTMVAKRNLTDTAAILTKAKPIQIKLREWHRSLPECLRMNNTKPRRLNSNGYLHLAYFAAEITLHRRIIRSLSDTLPDQIVSVCRSAAKARLLAAIELVDTLKHEHIQAFWHSSAAANFALIGSFAALLYVTSRDEQERRFYREQLLNYRWILRVGCKGFDEMGLALDKLEEAISQVTGLANEESKEVEWGDESDEGHVTDGEEEGHDNHVTGENGGNHVTGQISGHVTDDASGQISGHVTDHVSDHMTDHVQLSDQEDDGSIDLEKLVSEMNQ